jgi:hypothetical protein
VGGGIQVKFSKAGYEEIVKTFTATENDVLDFPDARQTAAIPSIGGAYTMTVTADPACPTTAASNRIAALPDDFRQPRSYAVSLTQDGPSLTVTLTDSAIRLQQNHFTGRVEPDSIEFQLGDGYYGYGLDDGVAEQLSPTQAYVFGGQLHAQRSGSAIVGRLNGPLEIYTQQATFYTLTGQCLAPNSPVTLTRGAQPARYR